MKMWLSDFTLSRALSGAWPERGVGTMIDVKAAKLDPTPLEALMEAAQ
jgi:hypothetical protein